MRMFKTEITVASDLSQGVQRHLTAMLLVSSYTPINTWIAHIFPAAAASVSVRGDNISFLDMTHRKLNVPPLCAQLVKDNS